MTATITTIVLLATALWAFTRFALRGENLARYDEPGHVEHAGPCDPSAGHHEALELLREFQAPSEGRASARDRLRILREKLDSLGDRADLGDVEIRPVDVDGVPGEWVLAAGADPKQLTDTLNKLHTKYGLAIFKPEPEIQDGSFKTMGK